MQRQRFDNLAALPGRQNSRKESFDSPPSVVTRYHGTDRRLCNRIPEISCSLGAPRHDCPAGDLHCRVFLQRRRVRPVRFAGEPGIL